MKYKVGDKEGSEVIDKDCYSYIFVCDNCGEGEEVSTWNEVKDCYSDMVVCDNCGEGTEVNTWSEVLEFMREVRENAARGKGGG